jgi:hypothetical protein
MKNPVYLQSVRIHSANGREEEGWREEGYSAVPLYEYLQYLAYNM